MSKVAIEGNASGTGTLTIAAPNTNSNFTLTIPDATTTIVGTDATQTLTNKSMVATQLTGTIAAARLPAGSVIQVVSATKSNTATTSSTSFIDIADMSVSITPHNINSKFLIQVMLGCVGNTPNAILFNLVRNSTSIAQPSGGTNPATVNHYAGGLDSGTASNMTFLDSPLLTAAITYKLQFRVDSSTGAINRHPNNAAFTSISTITVMEIAG